MFLCGSLVLASNRHIDVEMRSCLLAHEQVECPPACNPPTKRSGRKQGLNVFGLERNNIGSIGRLCVHGLSNALVFTSLFQAPQELQAFPWQCPPGQIAKIPKATALASRPSSEAAKRRSVGSIVFRAYRVPNQIKGHGPCSCGIYPLFARELLPILCEKF